MKKPHHHESANLRREAGERLAFPDGVATLFEGQDPGILIHELRVHQAELLMQNVELRRVEQVADDERRRYQDLYDFAPVGYFTLDERGAISEANLTGASLLGRELNELIGHPLVRFLSPGSGREFELFRRRVFLGKDRAPFEALLTVAGAGERWVLIEGMAYASGAEGRKSYRIALFDITARKRHERELMAARDAAEAANQAKGEFLANMSHELRTPLNAVIGLGYLAHQTSLYPRQQDYLTKIDTAADHLLHLLNDILDLSKIEAGKLHLEEVDFALRPLLEYQMSLIGVEATAKRLLLLLSADPRLPKWLVGDPLRLEQILLNLLGNAVRFTPQGEIELAVRPIAAEGEQVTLEFSVRDTGIGMTVDQLEEIFNNFSQADSSITRPLEGPDWGSVSANGWWR